MNISVKELIQLGLWSKFCDIKDWQPYIINEGLIDEDEVLFLEEDIVKELFI